MKNYGENKGIRHIGYLKIQDFIAKHKCPPHHREIFSSRGDEHKAKSNNPKDKQTYTKIFKNMNLQEKTQINKKILASSHALGVCDEAFFFG